MTRFPIESVVNVNSIVKVTHFIKCVITLLLNMTNMTRFPIESIVNVNSIVKVTHTIKCVITLLLNDKHDEITYRICRGCQFYSQSENANAKYTI